MACAGKCPGLVATSTLFRSRINPKKCVIRPKQRPRPLLIRIKITWVQDEDRNRYFASGMLHLSREKINENGVWAHVVASASRKFLLSEISCAKGTRNKLIFSVYGQEHFSGWQREKWRVKGTEGTTRGLFVTVVIWIYRTFDLFYKWRVLFMGVGMCWVTLCET